MTEWEVLLFVYIVGMGAAGYDCFPLREDRGSLAGRR